MSRNAKIAAGGVAAGLILLIWLPWWASLLIVLGVAGGGLPGAGPLPAAQAPPRLTQGDRPLTDGATGGWRLSLPSPSSC